MTNYNYSSNYYHTFYLYIFRLILYSRGKSPITDPLSYFSNYKRYIKIIYTRTVSNLMIHVNKYFVLKNI